LSKSGLTSPMATAQIDALDASFLFNGEQQTMHAIKATGFSAPPGLMPQAKPIL